MDRVLISQKNILCMQAISGEIFKKHCNELVSPLIIKLKDQKGFWQLRDNVKILQNSEEIQWIGSLGCVLEEILTFGEYGSK